MRAVLLAIFVVAIMLLAAVAAIAVAIATDVVDAGNTVTSSAGDGSSVTFACRAPVIKRATYGTGDDVTDVKPEVALFTAEHPSQPLAVGPATFPAAPASATPRSLAVVYTCDASAQMPREHIVPRRTALCTQPAGSVDPGPRLWTGQRNENWTVVDQPYDPESKIRLTSAALTPAGREVHLRGGINPITRIGVTSRVRIWENPYATDAEGVYGNPCAYAPPSYLDRHALIPRTNDSTDGTMYQGRSYYQPAYWTRASGPYGGPYRPLSSCPEDIGVDSNLASDGQYETEILGQENMVGREFAWQNTDVSPQPWSDNRNTRNLAMAAGIATPPDHAQQVRRSLARAAFVLPKETLRSSRRQSQPPSCMTGIGCGLGSTWIDPRFEPGPQVMYPQGDASYAPGGHAGGPTFGALMPYRFQVPGPHWTQYVRGYGDGRR